MSDNRLYLIHIIESIERIEDYTRGGWEVFTDSPMAQDAVVRNFEVIGEAAKRLPEFLKEERPDLGHPARGGEHGDHTQGFAAYISILP